MSNLLEASFLNAVWDLHMKILDIKVTAEEAGDALADAAVAVAETGDTLELPSRRLQSVAFSNSGKLGEGTQQRSGSQSADTKQQQVLALRRLAWGDPAAVVQQHFVEEQLRQQMQQQQQQNQWTPTGGGGRRRREGQAAAASTQQQQPQQALTHLQTQPEPVCDPERELPRVRITGLACRPPLPAGEYAFQNLCFKDSTGACEAPDGIIFVYGHKRYQITDDAKLRPFALRWERKLQQLLQTEKLPGATMGLKTERSLSDELAASSSAGPGGEVMLIAAAGSLIGAIVALTGAGAALLGYLGGAGVCFMSGVVSTGTAAAAPLLVVGIGVDDTLVLLQSYSLTVHKRSAADRLQLTLRDSGVGITITTLTNLLTFGIGAFSPYLAIKSFCLLCLAGLFLGYVMCLTFFLGFLALDAKAEAAGQVMGIFRCCPMKIMRDSAFTKTHAEQQLKHQHQHEGKGKQRRQMPTLKGLPMLQYVDKTRLPGADASALSACASDIFQCITMQVEAALQQQQQQRLLEAETRRIRKQQTSKKKKQRKKAPARRRKNAKTPLTSTSSGTDDKKQDDTSSDSENCKKKTRQRKQPARKTNARKKKLMESSNSSKTTNSMSNKRSTKSFRSSRSSAKKQQQQQRQRRAKALRPALKGRRQQQQQQEQEEQQEQPKQSEAPEPGAGVQGALEANSRLAAAAVAAAAGMFASGANLDRSGSKAGGVSVRPARPRRTTVHFYRKTSTAPLTASLPQQQQQPHQSGEWHDQVVVNLCVGSGSAVVAAAAEAAEAAFNTAGRSWSGERIARLQLMQRLGGDGLAEPQGNVGRGLRKVLVRFGARLLMNPFFKLMLLIVFTAVCATAIIGLYAWLQTPFGSSFTAFFSWSSGFRLRAWALMLVPKYFPSTQENSNFMHQLRADLAQFPLLQGAAYNRNFVYFESDDAIVPQTVSSLASAGCAVIVVSLFLLPSLRGAILVVGILLVIDIVILGFMALWGLPLNLLTMVNLTISIGGPLLHGALSTQLAVIPLAFVDSPVLSVFFKMTTLVIIVGVTHGLMLLPVLLSLIGPMQQSQQKMVQQLLALQKQYDRLEEQIVACGGSRENPRLKKQRKALRRLIEQQEQPPETARDACLEFAKGLCPDHPKNVFLRNRQIRNWVQQEK
ncbi:uncharacterized protein EMH_0011230 [Eimeria mitis]|uniref:SSD domain-containing protein n=1 Tax=Eimeria mitis TaxID=44415 RepID=U6K509_9EIME|nr:uncharacterized protein EMH_0011230 [Eimeria mitis]CDJ32071.1 hypothetical protein EMH_0011230 [Eimeria mitis]